mmetsp:Transcript_30816/g.56373  ORF Transcript_30816/g.56373 Transcript_30816/m.56373 type:complete len:461 (-) Transcript_30816:121-1503(-)
MSDSESVEEELSEHGSDDAASSFEKQSVAESQQGSQAGSQVQVLDDDDGNPPSPTAQEIEDYADFLGIDMKTESDLMWIAKEGVAAPVPHPWKACRQGDEIFYFNFETKESIWDHPSDQKYRDMVEKARKAKTRIQAGEDAEDGAAGAKSSEKEAEQSPNPKATGNATNDNTEQDGNENSHSSFVSGAVESADNSVVSSPRSAADDVTETAPAHGPIEAEEKVTEQEDATQTGAMPSPTQKEMAAMWKAASGGLACSTPRSRESSSSRSSPRNEVPPSDLDRFRSAGEVTVDPRSASKSSAGSVVSEPEQAWHQDIPQSPASSADSAADAEPAASPDPSAPDADTSRNSDGNRGASFEQGAWAPSARSSCPSEVSEDFSFSAKSSPPGGIAPDANSLEVSASASLDMTSANAIGSGGLRAECAAKTWKELDADLKALEGVLDIIKKVREQQQDFLKQILG